MKGRTGTEEKYKDRKKENKRRGKVGYGGKGEEQLDEWKKTEKENGRIEETKQTN